MIADLFTENSRNELYKSIQLNRWSVMADFFTGHEESSIQIGEQQVHSFRNVNDQHQES